MSIKFTSLYGGSTLNSNSNMSIDSDSDNESEYELNNIIQLLLQFRIHIKMFHWQTKQYSYHKVSDELLSSIDDLTDKFVESSLGLLNIRPNISITNSSLLLTNVNQEILLEQINKVSNRLTQNNKLLANTEIGAIRDEILIAINKAKYLMTFN
jgi:DNA-binding ferritin-like protein